MFFNYANIIFGEQAAAIRDEIAKINELGKA